MSELDFEQQRNQLVRDVLRRAGVTDARVLQAMKMVPREFFIPDELLEFAYHNTALPIASGQTISQPSMVAIMIQALALKSTDRVLEIGTGSGYAAAILAEIAHDVFTVERLENLAKTASGKLAALGYGNIHVLLGDGTQGWPEEAPFDAIVVAAGAPQVPPRLTDQLRIGGRLVIPVGEQSDLQTLLRIIRQGPDEFEREKLGDVRFVPLIGEAEGGAMPSKGVCPPP